MEPDDPANCYYMMHYSNPFYVLLFLVRVEPFTTLHIELCDAKFDARDRMFFSIPRAFASVTSPTPDFRELIPEFFTFPEFLLNDNEFDLGETDNGGKVKLPNWAHGIPHRFIELHRLALESSHVSEHLDEWINLIFGFQQTGRAAVEAKNTFHPSSYASAITPEVLQDPDLLQSIQTVAGTVGTIPRQIFTRPHPKRLVLPRVTDFVDDFVLCFRLHLPPLFVFGNGELFSTLLRDGSISAISLSKGTETTIGSITDSVFLTEGMTVPKSFAFMPEANRLVTGSLCDNCFHAFRIDAGSISHIDSFRQKFSLLSTVHYAGSNRLLTAWRDSSLTLWNLREPLYRVTPHLASLVDVDVSPALRLVASLDKDRKCVLSLLETGQFMRSFQIEGVETLSKLILFSAPFLAVIGELSGKSCVKLFGVDTRKVYESEFDGVVTVVGKAELDFGLNLMAIGFAKGRFVVVRIPDLRIVVDVQGRSDIVSVNFSPQLFAFIVATVTGDVFRFML
jgi:hypothetical protein